MSDVSNEIIFEGRDECGTFTTSAKALMSYHRDLQELVEMKCREEMVRSLYNELNKGEESKWSVFDALQHMPLFRLVMDRPLVARFSVGNEDVEFSSN